MGFLEFSAYVFHSTIFLFHRRSFAVGLLLFFCRICLKKFHERIIRGVFASDKSFSPTPPKKDETYFEDKMKIFFSWGLYLCANILKEKNPSRNRAGIEDLKEKREEVNKQIVKDEEEKQKIQNDLRMLTERLSRVNDSLARKVASRNEYDKTIMETEAAYMKVWH